MARQVPENRDVDFGDTEPLTLLGKSEGLSPTFLNSMRSGTISVVEDLVETRWGTVRWVGLFGWTPEYWDGSQWVSRSVWRQRMQNRDFKNY